jgi:polyhydroxyalkanoate synthesis regulator phasin
MMNSIKKVLLAGVGAALITKDKAEEALDDFVQQGRIDAKDAKAMARKIAKDSRKEFASVRSDVEDRLLDLTRRAGAEAQARIAALEARVAELQKQKQAAARKPARRPKASAKGA